METFEMVIKGIGDSISLLTASILVGYSLPMTLKSYLSYKKMNSRITKMKSFICTFGGFLLLGTIIILISYFIRVPGPQVSVTIYFIAFIIMWYLRSRWDLAFAEEGYEILMESEKESRMVAVEQVPLLEEIKSSYEKRDSLNLLEEFLLRINVPHSPKRFFTLKARIDSAIKRQEAWIEKLYYHLGLPKEEQKKKSHLSLVDTKETQDD